MYDKLRKRIRITVFEAKSEKYGMVARCVLIWFFLKSRT